VVVLQRLVDVGERLRLDPLRRVHHQERAFAGGQAPAHLIGEVDVTRGVHQVEGIGLPVGGLVHQAHGLGLDGDAPLALDIHAVEHLLLHLARRQAAAGLDKAVGQGRLAVIDMGDDRKIADELLVEHGSRLKGVREHREESGPAQPADLRLSGGQ